MLCLLEIADGASLKLFFESLDDQKECDELSSDSSRFPLALSVYDENSLDL